jgi:hypothetical protein
LAEQRLGRNSVEGLSPDDQSRASQTTVEIADVALYFGDVPSFGHGARKTVAQFKYSVADKDKEFRASKAKKTIAKFANAYSDLHRGHPARADLPFDDVPVRHGGLQSVQVVTHHGLLRQQERVEATSIIQPG